MSRLGLGLLGRPLPPEYASMILFMDATRVPSGLVGSWRSSVGSAEFVAAGAAQPTKTANYIQFDGVNNVLARPADAQSHPGGSTKATVVHWVWADSIAATLRCPFATADETSGLWWQVTSAINVQYALVGANANTANARNFTAGGWRLVAYSFDGTQPPGSRCIQYYGETVDTIAAVPGVDNTPAVVPAAAGNSSIGQDSTYNRRWQGRVRTVGLWRTNLRLDQIRRFAVLQAP